LEIALNLLSEWLSPPGQGVIPVVVTPAVALSNFK
jgi:hypothetical protein